MSSQNCNNSQNISFYIDAANSSLFHLLTYISIVI